MHTDVGASRRPRLVPCVTAAVLLALAPLATGADGGRPSAAQRQSAASAASSSDAGPGRVDRAASASSARRPRASGDAQAPPHVVLTTSLGDIEVELDAARAPLTTRNFLRYVEGGRYDGGAFHRTVRADNQPENRIRIAVVQAGVAPRWAEKDHAPIALEPTGRTGLAHRDGTISMARATPDTATSDFFICVGDQPDLDEGGRRNPDGRGFAAFGRVVRGMDVVRRINAAAADGQKLTPPVAIVRARVVTAGK